MKAHVWVMLKKTVLDPQGQTIQHALADLGYQKVQAVRQGKFFVLELNGLNRDEAQQQVEKIAGTCSPIPSSKSSTSNSSTDRLAFCHFVRSSAQYFRASRLPPGGGEINDPVGPAVAIHELLFGHLRYFSRFCAFG